jgi:hypothetical protein
VVLCKFSLSWGGHGPFWRQEGPPVHARMMKETVQRTCIQNSSLRSTAHLFRHLQRTIKYPSLSSVSTSLVVALRQGKGFVVRNKGMMKGHAVSICSNGKLNQPAYTISVHCSVSEAQVEFVTEENRSSWS